MNILNHLTKITSKGKKRRGQGYGSGRGGHTSGRGHKGDKARGKTKLTFDGSKIKKSWIKRTPFLRGKHRLLAKTPAFPISLARLDLWFKDGQTVSLACLAKFIPLSSHHPKILATGKLTKSLKIKGLPLSAAAQKQIIKAGGSILK